MDEGKLIDFFGCNMSKVFNMCFWIEVVGENLNKEILVIFL